ncbi:Odorant-binding protein 69a [Carabus blaptoides fortunei]
MCFVASSVQGLSDEMKDVIAMLHTTCQTETGVPEDMIQNTIKGEFPDDTRLKCYFKCIMTEMATMDDDGVVDVESTIAMLPEEFQGGGIPETIRKCGTQTGTDHCDTAWLTTKCYYDDNPSKYFVI